MYNVRKVTEDVVWIGGNDRRLALVRKRISHSPRSFL